MIEERHFDPWSSADPRKTGRKELNDIIKLVNGWTIAGCPEEDIDMILCYIERGLQTFATQDERGGWAKLLREMRQYVQDQKHS